jgi:arylsulfatase A-like enzyme
VGINPDETTLAELLKGVGYRTALVGKWHLGHYPPFLPPSHGFDYYFGLPYSNDMTPMVLMENDAVVEETPEQSSLTMKYTDKALAFIEENQHNHFFLYLSHNMPHFPVAASPSFNGTSAYGPYGDAVQELDWSTSKILEKLESLNIDQRTLVIYTSDNGGNISRGDQQLGRNIPLRGGKTELWEGGIRVPCIMRWPGTLREAATVDEAAAFIDIYPTIARLAHAEIPEDRVIDGLDIWPVIQEGAASPHDYLFYGLRGVRDSRWKLIDGQLFDLVNDIGETTNLAAEHPDMANDLQGVLDAFVEDVVQNKRPVASLADFPDSFW